LLCRRLVARERPDGAAGRPCSAQQTLVGFDREEDARPAGAGRRGANLDVWWGRGRRRRGLLSWVWRPASAHPPSRSALSVRTICTLRSFLPRFTLLCCCGVNEAVSHVGSAAVFCEVSCEIMRRRLGCSYLSDTRATHLQLMADEHVRHGDNDRDDRGSCGHRLRHARGLGRPCR
jgi:hypothetical protein